MWSIETRIKQYIIEKKREKGKKLDDPRMKILTISTPITMPQATEGRSSESTGNRKINLQVTPLLKMMDEFFSCQQLSTKVSLMKSSPKNWIVKLKTGHYKEFFPEESKERDLENRIPLTKLKKEKDLRRILK